MKQAIVCNACKEMFVAERKDIISVTDGDLEIQYFSCPKCHKKYLVLAADEEMRGLIERYKKVAAKFKAAHIGKFRAAEIRKFERELAEIKKKQMQKRPELNRLGRAYLERSHGHEPEQ